MDENHTKIMQGTTSSIQGKVVLNGCDAFSSHSILDKEDISILFDLEQMVAMVDWKDSQTTGSMTTVSDKKDVGINSIFESTYFKNLIYSLSLFNKSNSFL